MAISHTAARDAIDTLARSMGTTAHAAAAGIIKVAESNIAAAVRAVTARRGYDPRRAALISFGGAGGLHAAGVAAQLGMSRVIIPPFCGALSALGMVVAASRSDASQTVLHESGTDDGALSVVFGRLEQRASAALQGAEFAVERFADVRFKGQSHELSVPVETPARSAIAASFIRAYEQVFHAVPTGRDIEIVTLRVRLTGRPARLVMPALTPDPSPPARISLIDNQDIACTAPALTRAQLAYAPVEGPALLIDDEATAFVPRGWRAAVIDQRDAGGAVELTRVIREGGTT